MKTVLIVGSKGMAGHVVKQYLKEQAVYNVIDIARNSENGTPSYSVDVTDFAELEDVLKTSKPDVVVNCIGVLNQTAEKDPAAAVLLNSYLPHFLAKTGTKYNYKLIHISTDCVFNGKKGDYVETDFKDGYGFYAQTKALGEIDYDNHLTIRTSIIGPELKNGIGLFNWFMRSSGEIKGFTNALWTGVTTIELAKIIDYAIKTNKTGLHHLVNGTKISKYDLVKSFKNIFGKKDVTIIPDDAYKVDKSLVDSKKTFGYVVPSYDVMIEEMQRWVNDHPQFYSLY